jgi:hypothetical protein
MITLHFPLQRPERIHRNLTRRLNLRELMELAGRFSALRHGGYAHVAGAPFEVVVRSDASDPDQQDDTRRQIGEVLDHFEKRLAA